MSAKRIEEIRRLAAQGKTRQQVADEMGCSYKSVASQAKKHGIAFQNARTVSSRTKERAVEMAVLYRSGQTLEEVGVRFGISAVRVGQIISTHQGVSAADGGRRARSRRKREEETTRKNAIYQRKYGCTFSEWRAVCAIGRQMLADGRSKYQTPLGAFHMQKANAIGRGIGWHLTFWQWWTIWQKSGHWDCRGLHKGEYVMCRVEDSGPYALGNVFISTCSENVSSYRRSDRAHEADLALAVVRQVAA